MIHLDSHITADTNFGVETRFTSLMGHLDVIPLIARGINIYLPILIVLLCLGTWFRLGTRFLHSLGIDQFMDDDDMTTEMIQGGKRYVTIERNRMSREKGREERNATFGKRFGGGINWKKKFGNVITNSLIFIDNTNRNGGSGGGGGGGFSIPSYRQHDDDRIPILHDLDDDAEVGLLLEDNGPPTSALLAPSKPVTRSILTNDDDMDFSFASEGGFIPSQLTLAGVQRAARAQDSAHHPTPSNMFDDL